MRKDTANLRQERMRQSLSSSLSAIGQAPDEELIERLSYTYVDAKMRIEIKTALQSRISEVERLTALASELVTLLIDEDHKRLCQGREYVCSCKYNGDVQHKARVLRAALSQHRGTNSDS